MVAARDGAGSDLLLAVALGLALAAQTGAAQPPAAKPDSLVGGLLAGLGKQPFVLLFLVVAAGYALGRVQIKGVGLGGHGVHAAHRAGGQPGGRQPRASPSPSPSSPAPSSSTSSCSRSA